MNNCEFIYELLFNKYDIYLFIIKYLCMYLLIYIISEYNKGNPLNLSPTMSFKGVILVKRFANLKFNLFMFLKKWKLLIKFL